MNKSMAWSLAAIGVAGCQQYSPHPLDSAAHRAEWISRAVNGETVAAFAARLDQPTPSSSGALALDDAAIVALALNPDLRVARAEAATALAHAEHAGRWDDPTISFDALRILESVPDRWIVGGAIGFNVPLSGRLGAERALADAEHELALRQVVEREQATLASLRKTWVEWTSEQLVLELITGLIERLEQVAALAGQLEQAGEISRMESRLFRMELESRRIEQVRIAARVAELATSIRSMMGLTPDAPVVLQPTLAVDQVGPIDDAFAMLDERSASLAASRAAYDVAEQTLKREVRRQYPDLQIGPAYESDEGQSRLGLGLGWTLPIFNANRQAIATAVAARDAARRRHEALHERLVAEVVAQQAVLEAAREGRARIEQVILPLHEAQLDDEHRVAALGELDVLVTLESVVRDFEARQQLIEARRDEAVAASRLRQLLGDPTDPPIGKGHS
jgi:cobalt-zinc-cadmium efflux system outer membrane protein